MTGAWRAMRAAALGASSLACGLAAHVSGDGCLPWLGVAVCAAVLLAPAWSFTAAPRTRASTVLWLAGTQVGLHLMLAGFCERPVAADRLPVLALHAAAVVVLATVWARNDGASWSAASLARAAYALARHAARRLAPGPLSGGAPPLWLRRCLARGTEPPWRPVGRSDPARSLPRRGPPVTA